MTNSDRAVQLLNEARTILTEAEGLHEKRIWNLCIRRCQEVVALALKALLIQTGERSSQDARRCAHRGCNLQGERHGSGFGVYRVASELFGATCVATCSCLLPGTGVLGT
ncbi:MAG: HEPN domain-containing protein [Acidobacteriota bacterium]